MRRLAAAALTALAFAAPAKAVEEPRYAVDAKEGALEIRRYEPMIVAEVAVAEAGRWPAANAGFRPLARYIFGGNATGQEIAMTAPVTQTAAADGWRVQFVMPTEWTRAALPAPTDQAVTIKERPAQRVAAIRFSGRATDEAVRRRQAELEAFMAAQGVKAAGATIYAYYDPPFTPPFLRRNEILVPLAEAAGG